MTRCGLSNLDSRSDGDGIWGQLCCLCCSFTSLICRRRKRHLEAKVREKAEKACAKSAALEKYHQLSEEEKRKRVEHKRVGVNAIEANI